MITCEEHFACLMLTITRGIISPEHYIKFKCSWESRNVWLFVSASHYISWQRWCGGTKFTQHIYLLVSSLGKKVESMHCISVFLYIRADMLPLKNRGCIVVRLLLWRKLLHLRIRRIKGSSLPHQSFSDYSLSPRWDTREIMLREKWLVKVSSIV